MEDDIGVLDCPFPPLEHHPLVVVGPTAVFDDVLVLPMGVPDDVERKLEIHPYIEGAETLDYSRGYAKVAS